MIDLPFALAGAMTGFVVGLTGVGGGALMTPVLLLVFGISPVTAIATDLWFAVITKLVAARTCHTSGHVDWPVVKRLWWGSLPASALVVALVSMGAPITKVESLTVAIGFVIILTAVGLLASPALLKLARSRRLGQPQRFKAAQPVLTVLAGGILGISVGLTSIGAGALGSVMLLYLYPLSMHPHRLVATDIIHAIPLAVFAGMGYLLSGMVDGQMLISLVSGSIPAVILGSLMNARISGRWVQVALAVVLLVAGLKVLI